MKDIIIILGSITKASKVKRMLSGSGIRADLTKSSTTDTGECIHGIRIKEGDMYRTVMMLRNQGIEYRVEK